MYVDPEILLILDELVRVDLQSARNTYFNDLLLSSFVVAVGVILEGPEVVHEWKLWRKERISPVSSAERAPSWIKLFGLIGWVLVAIGVLGEGVSESYVSRADGHLEAFNNTLLAETNARASSANALAKLYESRIADSNARASEAQRKTMELRALVMPVDLSDKQQSAIGEACKRYSGKTVIVSGNGADIEGRILAGLIVTALKKGGIKVRQPTLGMTWLNTANGVTVSGPDQGFVRSLGSSLASIGDLYVDMLPSTKNDKDTVISIGIYPFKLPRK